MSVLIALGLTLSTKLENAKYEASLRDAARQTIEDDIVKVKNYLLPWTMLEHLKVQEGLLSDLATNQTLLAPEAGP